MPEAFVELMLADELADQRPVRADSPWGPLLVYRRGEQVFAVSNVCTHMGAPLHRGSINRQTPMPWATCPAHGSMFDLATGAVRRGPAMEPVRAYEAEIREERVVARPRTDSA
jgi:nitrite reductase/ring-hydroxylating ferredoxin subunit